MALEVVSGPPSTVATFPVLRVESVLLMGPRRINFLLKGAAALLLMAATGVIAVGLMVPTGPQEEHLEVRTAASRPATSPVAQLPALPEFERVWSRRLRPTFGKAGPGAETGIDAPAAMANATAQPSGVGVTLVGTIGDSVALIRDGTGNVAAHVVGEAIAGAGTVVAVRPAEVDLQINGSRVTLRKAPEPELPQASPLSMPPTDPSDDPQLGMLNDGQTE